MRTHDPEHREKRRADLLDAAAACFAQAGFAQTRSADITTRAGLSSGSLYYYFRTKHELLLALIDREATSLAEVTIPTSPPAARATLRALIDEACRQAGDTTARGLALEIAALALRDPEVKARARRADTALRAVIAQLVTAGDSPRDPDMAATWIAAMIDGVFTRAAVQQGFRPLAEKPALHNLASDFLQWR